MHIFRASTIQNPLPRWKLLYKIAVSNCEPRTTLIYLDSVKCRQTNGDNQLNHYAQRKEKERQFKSISFRSIRSISIYYERHPKPTSRMKAIVENCFCQSFYHTEDGTCKSHHMGQEWHDCNESSPAKSVISAFFAVEKMSTKKRVITSGGIRALASTRDFCSKFFTSEHPL